MNIVEESLRPLGGFHWLKNHPVSEPPDGNLLGIEAEFLRNPDGLRAAVEENGCCHIWYIPKLDGNVKMERNSWRVATEDHHYLSPAKD